MPFGSSSLSSNVRVARISDDSSASLRSGVVKLLRKRDRALPVVRVPAMILAVSSAHARIQPLGIRYLPETGALSQSVATMGGDDAALTIIEYPLRNVYYCRPPEWSGHQITTYDHFVHLFFST